MVCITEFTTTVLEKECRGYELDGVNYYSIEDVIGNNPIKDGTQSSFFNWLKCTNYIPRDKYYLKYIARNEDGYLEVFNEWPLDREVEPVITAQGLRERLTYVDYETLVESAKSLEKVKELEEQLSIK